MAAINKRLVERGHSVTVLTSDAADFELFWDRSAKRFTENEDQHEGVRILRLPVRHLPLSRLAFPAVRLLTGWMARVAPHSGLIGRMTRLTPRIPAMHRWLEQSKDEFDLVLGMTITLEGVIQMGQDYAKQQGIPFVVFPLTHLGYGSQPGTDRSSLFYTLPQQNGLVLGADGLVANNPAEEEYYSELGMAAEKIIVAPPAPDPERLEGGNGANWREEFGVGDTPIVAVVSTLSKEKGTLDTLEAMERLWKDGVQAKLVLAGNIMPDIAEAVEKIAEEHKSNLILRGRISDAERNNLLAAADIFCMPSVADSFGIAFTEAMLFKTPVIGAEVWGVKEFVIRDGENGFLVQQNETELLAAKIKQLLADPDLARQMGENGFAYASQLSWKTTVDQIEALLTRLTPSNQIAGGAA